MRSRACCELCSSALARHASKAQLAAEHRSSPLAQLGLRLGARQLGAVQPAGHRLLNLGIACGAEGPCSSASAPQRGSAQGSASRRLRGCQAG